MKHRLLLSPLRKNKTTLTKQETCTHTATTHSEVVGSPSERAEALTAPLLLRLFCDRFEVRETTLLDFFCFFFVALLLFDF